MSAPKSLVRSQKLARKRQRKVKARLRRKGRANRVPRERPAIGFVGPAGGVSMSDVLERFMEPLAEDLDGIEAYHRLLTLATLAWNAALRPQAEGQQMVEDLLRETLGRESRETQAMCREVVRVLVERKRRLFAQYRRPIVNFAVEDRGDHYYLTVMSLLS